MCKLFHWKATAEYCSRVLSWNLEGFGCHHQLNTHQKKRKNTERLLSGIFLPISLKVGEFLRLVNNIPKHQHGFWQFMFLEQCEKLSYPKTLNFRHNTLWLWTYRTGIRRSMTWKTHCTLQILSGKLWVNETQNEDQQQHLDDTQSPKLLQRHWSIISNNQVKVTILYGLRKMSKHPHNWFWERDYMHTETENDFVNYPMLLYT